MNRTFDTTPRGGAIYARYSSDRQSEASIDDQIRLCRRLAGQHGETIAYSNATGQ